jgi:Flp pilus assembly pilin Flp
MTGRPAVKHAIAVVGRFVGRDDAQDLLEYGLLVVLIALIAMGSVQILGGAINTLFWQKIAQNF